MIICCVAEKYSKKQISPIIEVNTDSPHEACEILNNMPEMPKIDGENTYLDWVVAE